MTGQFAANMDRVRILAEQGLYARMIADRLGVCADYVRYLAKQANIALPKKPKKQRPPRRNKRGRPPGSYSATPSDRTRAMAALFQSGQTLEQIGQQYGITRERVRQIIKRFHGLKGRDGGAAQRAADRHAMFCAARDERCVSRWGCTYDQYVLLRALKKPTRAYSAQRKSAEWRGIAWEFSLWSWWTVWQQSGLWEQRGRGQGYVMCRKGDVGPYSPENVYIATAAQNSSEGQRKRKAKGDELPIGVTIKKNRFIALRSVAGKKLYLGSFETVEQAHAAYLSASLENRSAA